MSNSQSLKAATVLRAFALLSALCLASLAQAADIYNAPFRGHTVEGGTAMDADYASGGYVDPSDMPYIALPKPKQATISVCYPRAIGRGRDRLVARRCLDAVQRAVATREKRGLRAREIQDFDPTPRISKTA